MLAASRYERAGHVSSREVLRGNMLMSCLEFRNPSLDIVMYKLWRPSLIRHRSGDMQETLCTTI